MKMRTDLRIAVALLAVLLLLCLSACTPDARDRRDDLYVTVPGLEQQVLVKEWSFLLGAGQEIYLVARDGESLYYLGDCYGGDDGYTPFENGEYEMTVTDGILRVSWAFRPSGSTRKQKDFTLPTDFDTE